MRPLLACAWLVLCSALFVGSARAQEKDIGRMIDNLASSSDFRVRTQAALALGASKQQRAVQPLCRGLGDSNTTVRAAAAAALGRLRMGGNECLEKRLKTESTASVKAAIQKALQLMTGEAEPAITASTRYYVSIGKTADKTGRSGDDIDKMVRAAMSSAATNLDGFVIAPASETTPQAKKRLNGRSGIKPFYLSPRIAAPDYSGGNLTVRIEVAMFTYPEKALIGNYSVKLTSQGVSEPSPESEDELIKMAAERAMEKFAKTAEKIQ